MRTYSLKWKAAIVALLAGWVLVVGVVQAQLIPTAPQLFVRSDGLGDGITTPVAIQNVIEEGDTMVITRIEIPDVNWATHGVDATLARLFSDDVSVQDRTPFRLDSSMAVFYLAAEGNPLPWDAGTGSVRLISQPTIFAQNSSDESPIETWVTPDSLVASSATAQAQLCGIVRDMLTIVQQANELSGDDLLVANNAITEAGTLRVTEWFAAFPELLPDCFVVGVTGSGQAFDPGEAALRNTLIGQVEATQAWLRWEEFIGDYDLAVLWGTFFFFVVSLGAMVVATMSFGVHLGLLAFVLGMLTGGMAVPHWLAQMSFLLVALLLVFAGWFILQRIPR